MPLPAPCSAELCVRHVTKVSRAGALLWLHIQPLPIKEKQRSEGNEWKPHPVSEMWNLDSGPCLRSVFGFLSITCCS